LSLHGAKAPVTLTVKLNKRGLDPATRKEAAGFSATARLKRSDFGMTTALGMVGDDVTITIEALAHRSE
ncbi:MAG TPA: polyisoprenoid-binding protein, partial [Parvularcula sp.]|nr:polyisoprenoid-binding protein [Parvularcula sp.]HBS33341.1 polyisoprenoid-binding protein [Parvularcula sp.]HBS33473.1 polyisoprenoid-binding protein [Parvularcula sp.]